MKKKTFFLAAALFLMKIPAMATGEGIDNITTTDTTNIGSSVIAIPYPEKAFKNNIEGFVLVELNRNSAGVFVLTQINGSDAELIEAVRNHLAKNPPVISSPNDAVVFQFNFNIY